MKRVIYKVILVFTGVIIFSTEGKAQCPDPYSNGVNIVTHDTIICSGTSVQLTVKGGSDYSWSPADGLNCTDCATVTASPANSITYYLSAVNAGCSAKDSVVISVISSPEIFACPDVNVCQNSSVFLAAVGNGDYHWYPANGLSCTNCSNPVCSPAMSTTYTVTNTLCGSVSDEIIVKVVSKPFIATSPDVIICKGYGDTIAVAPVALGGTYNWSPAAGLSCTDCQQPYATPSVTTTFTIVLNNKGCQSKDSVVISVLDLPMFTAGNDTTICEGHAAYLHANIADSYSWSPTGYLSSNTSSSPVASPTVTTKYFVTGERACGTLKDSVTVFIKQKPVISVSGDTSLCSGQSVKLNVTEGESYQWSPANGLSRTDISDPVATPGHSSTYFVKVYNFPDCYSEDSVKVRIVPFPTIQLESEVDIICGQPVQLSPVVSDFTSHYWKMQQGIKDTTQIAPFVNPADATTYTFVASNEGCMESAEVLVNVLKGDAKLPAAFSPNGDGHNEIFRLKQTCGFIISDFFIYNRWGQTVFHTTSSTDGWDGRYNGKDADAGVYIYVLSGYTDNSNKVITMQGNVTLLR